MAARSEAIRDADLRAWLSWTIFDWAGWLSRTRSSAWSSPGSAVGVRSANLVTGVLLVPIVVSLLWFSIFGGGAMGLLQRATMAPAASRSPRRA